MRDSAWSPCLQERFSKILDEPPGLVCVDFDNTLIRGDFGENLMEGLLRENFPLADEPEESSPRNLNSDALLAIWGWNYEKLFRSPSVAKDLHVSRDKRWRDYVFEEYSYIRDTRGLGASYRWSSFLFSGWEESEFRSLARKIWEENLRSYQMNPSFYKKYPYPFPMKVHPREPLLDFLLELKSLGWIVNIVTASPAMAVEEATPKLGLSRSDVIGMQLCFNSLGRTTAEIIEPYPFGTGKVEAILKKFSRYPDLAFGDTVNDLAMLQSATRLGILFQRGYTDLNEKAQEQNIYIEEWI